MRRRTLARDLAGTLLMLAVLLAFVFLIILGEHFLDNFKAH
jgi:hypothetical protein